MSIDLSKTSHILFFVVLLPVISFGIGYAASIAWPHAPFWVETISPLAAYGLLYGFFNKIAWRWPLFRWLGIVTVRDMSGRWYGNQLSSFKKGGKAVKSRIILEVTQTFSDVRAQAFYKRWQSLPNASCLMTIDDHPTLVIIFASEPNANHDGDDTQHKGTAQLRYFVDDDSVRGTYFNTSGNSGDIILKRSTKPAIGRFE